MIKSGVIDNNETWSGKITIRGDVVIPEDVFVRVAPGTKIQFEAGAAFESEEKRKTIDELKLPVPGGKADASRPYIVVHGALEVHGEGKNRVAIGNEGWGGGILLLTEKEFSIRHAVIRHAGIGVCATGVSPALIRDTEVAHCVVGIFYPSRPEPTSIENNTLRDNTCGIVSYCLSEFSRESVRITGNTVTGSRGFGIFCADIRPVICGNTVTGNDTGIGHSDCETSRIENNDISKSRIGIYGSGIVSDEILNNRVADSAEAGIFIHKNTTKAVISGNTLAGSVKAMTLSDVREGTVAGNTITDVGLGVEIGGTGSVRVSGGRVHARDIGIAYEEHSSGSVEGTAISGKGGKDAVGIRVGGSAEVSISKNEIAEVSVGIQCADMARIVAAGNTICARAAGMSCAGHAGGVIKDNKISEG